MCNNAYTHQFTSSCFHFFSTHDVSASRSVLIIIIIKLSPEISEVTGGKPQHREIIRVFLNF